MDFDFTKEEFLKIFGRKVHSLRKEKKFSYRELAKRCDIDFSDISKIEKGERNIQLSTVLELAKGLEVHPQELFCFKIE